MIVKPSFTLTPETALPYLAERGFDSSSLRVTELAGGVSNVVLLAEDAAGRFVLKQALPQLRVQQEWFSDIRRIYTECAGLRAVAAMLPAGSVPAVLFEDPPNYLFAMTAADPGAESWKSRLFAGECDARVAEGVASMLGTMIRKSWHSAEMQEAFADIGIFEELRLDPYYARMAKLYPEMRSHFEELIAACRTRRVSLVHGDWSPKNILVRDGRAMAIDFEVMHFGDPSFDAAFLLNHLLLKTFYGIAGAPALATAFWNVLVSELPPAPWFERATIAHLGGLLLARMDGKSPAEYIQSDDLKQKIRNFAHGLIIGPPHTVGEVWDRYAAEIETITAYEILDSRGNPTVAARVTLSTGLTAMGHAPSGASTGKHEAVELRDNDAERYGGKGVLRAVGNVGKLILPAVRGMEADSPHLVDARLIELDGTRDKSNLGANAMLAVSCAVRRAASLNAEEPLWKWLRTHNPESLPVPMVNILSGGLHAGRNIEFQDFLVMAHGFDTFSEALHATTRVHLHARLVLETRGYTVTGVADEGGWGPSLPSNETALQIVTEAIERAGYRPAEHFSIALDVAASHFERAGMYELSSEDRVLNSTEMISLLENWTSRYPIASIEDALEQDDWKGWAELTARLGPKVQLVGDDFFTTNPHRLQRGIEAKSANAVLVKMNQIGTVTEALEVLEMARQNNYAAVVSARSGETEDSFLADLAVGSGAGQIKVGSITRSERLAKYNRLLEIEKDHGVPYFNKLIVPRQFAAPQ